MERLNRLLDRLPRTRFGRGSRAVPAFRSCGVVGFHVAVVTTFAAALITGLPLLDTAGLCAVCGLSFFVYTYARKAVTGGEKLVLLEHVWFAWLCATGYAFALGEPALPYLAAAAPGMCLFLAAGRVGCTLVGCCHGRPASVGIVYGEACARDGFPRAWVGVRLLPVPALECLGLVAIAATSFAALPFAPASHVFAWVLIAYSVLRFGLEGLRADRRPHLAGLSQARWMSIAEVVLAIELVDPLLPHRVPVYASLAALLAASLAARRALDPRTRLLRPAHLTELRQLAARAERADADAAPVAARSSLGVTVVATPLEGRVHVSIRLPDEQTSVAVAGEVLAHAFPELRTSSARVGSSGVVHATLPGDWNPGASRAPSAGTLEQVAGRLAYGEQRSRDADPCADVELTPVVHPELVPDDRPWYFADVAATPDP